MIISKSQKAAAEHKHKRCDQSLALDSKRDVMHERCMSEHHLPLLRLYSLSTLLPYRHSPCFTSTQTNKTRGVSKTFNPAESKTLLKKKKGWGGAESELEKKAKLYLSRRVGILLRFFHPSHSITGVAFLYRSLSTPRACVRACVMRWIVFSSFLPHP